MLAQVGAAAATVGIQWVSSLLNKQSKDVSPYFSGNGNYANNVTAQKGRYNNVFSKYASRLPEGSSEAKEYLAISRPSLDWMGQRNASITPINVMENEGQRLVNQYQKSQTSSKAAEVVNNITDPIKNFFSLFSTRQAEPATAYLGMPKTDTVIPIIITPEAQPEESGTGFEKFALPVGIAVVSGVLLFILRR